MELKLTILPGESACDQIAEQVRMQVALGKLKSGDRLPAIRDMARTLGFDPGTIARAYRELEREGIIIARRGRGSFVSSPTGERYITELRQKRLGVAVEKAILEALSLGFTVEDMETAFTLHLAGWRERRATAPGRKSHVRKPGGKIISFRGSHDIAVELLSVHIGTLNPSVRMTADFNGSLAGLVALERGEADIAGAHLIDEESSHYNTPFVKKLLPNESVTLINLVQRIQGLMVKPGNPKHILNIRDLARKDITFVNRQKGSGTRILLDAQLRRESISPVRVKGYDREETTHNAIASAVAGGEADVGLGAQSAAYGAGLDFIPLVKERYDLVILTEKLKANPFNLIPQVVSSHEFRSMLESIPGYDISETGNTVTVNP